MAADKGSGAAGAASAEIGKYLEILAKDPNSRVFAPLAEAYRKAGLLDDAIETAREGLNVHPNYLGGRVALGRALFEKKSFGEAADEMRKVVKAAADNIIAHKVLGQIALAQGALPDAEKAFRMVVLLDPHDQDAKKALADIGAGVVPPPQAAPAPAPVAAAPPVPKVAPATAPAPTAPPPPAEASPWGEMALEGLDSGRVELEEPRPQPPLTAKPEPITLDDIGVEPPPIDLEDIEPAAAPPPPLPDIPLPASEPAEPAAEIEIFGREPAVAPVELAPPPATPAPDAESPFEVFGRQKALRPGETARGEQEAYADIDLEAVAQPAPEPAQAPGQGQDEEQDGVFEIFTREPRPRDAAAARPAHEDRPVLEQLELEPTAHLPLEPPEGEPPVIELREEIPRIDVQSELELALAQERDADTVPAPEPGPPPVGEEIGWEDASPSLDVAEPREESAVPVLSPEEAATEELVWEEPAAPAEPPPPAATEVTEELAAAAAPECAAAEELPIPLDAGPGVELPADWDDAAPAAVLAEASVPEPATAWLESPVDLPALVPPPAEPAAQAGDIEVSTAETVISLEEEIPSVDLAGEIGPDASLAEDVEEAEGESVPEPTAETVAEPAAEPAAEPVAEPVAEPPAETAGSAAPAAAGASSAARGVFDTETLASIYINQGFYGRAAAIYERLVTASPDDAALRRKLDEVRALERAQGATAAAEPAASTAGGRPDRAETIRRLEALLAAFRGGRPR